MGTTSPDTGYPSNSTASSPGLGRSLMTCQFVHGMSLTLVLGHVRMNECHNIWPDWRLEYSWEGGLATTLAIFIKDRHDRACCLLGIKTPFN